LTDKDSGITRYRTRINNITDRTPDLVCSRYRGSSFTITLRQKPKGVPNRQR